MLQVHRDPDRAKLARYGCICIAGRGNRLTNGQSNPYDFRYPVVSGGLMVCGRTPDIFTRASYRWLGGYSRS